MEIKCKKCSNPFLERIDVARFIDDGGITRSKTDIPPFILFRCPVCGETFEVATSIVNYRVQQERALMISNIKNRPAILKETILDAVEEYVANEVKKNMTDTTDYTEEVEAVKTGLELQLKELITKIEELSSDVKKLKTKATKADKVKVDERLKD